jgi:hypothetical protein
MQKSASECANNSLGILDKDNMGFLHDNSQDYSHNLRIPRNRFQQ